MSSTAQSGHRAAASARRHPLAVHAAGTAPCASSTNPDEVHLQLHRPRRAVEGESTFTLRRSPEMAVRDYRARGTRDVADTATALRPGRHVRSSEG